MENVELIIENKAIDGEMDFKNEVRHLFTQIYLKEDNEYILILKNCHITNMLIDERMVNRPKRNLHNIKFYNCTIGDSVFELGENNTKLIYFDNTDMHKVNFKGINNDKLSIQFFNCSAVENITVKDCKFKNFNFVDSIMNTNFLDSKDAIDMDEYLNKFYHSSIKRIGFVNSVLTGAKFLDMKFDTFIINSTQVGNGVHEDLDVYFADASMHNFKKFALDHANFFNSPWKDAKIYSVSTPKFQVYYIPKYNVVTSHEFGFNCSFEEFENYKVNTEKYGEGTKDKELQEELTKIISYFKSVRG